ncbi:hypothetical protein HQ865_10540 [Mucilaginibacter mali]|uniref:Glycoside hydrolase family 65 n=1 Tax=Mucilaginibacter mali TaxID=2740462 RepID=A0A7D4ULN2_9SPHI|nr:hypothetical protein [Mucilaginibacter mali]QKJ30181.1 hypothetical protein HQ865_10540 [Mucilaginibacter mali]
MKKILSVIVITSFSLGFTQAQKAVQKIDRKALVTRHNVVNKWMDTLASLTVGNGRFAFTVDATGLQTFPEHYAKGVPLGTQSEWGWGKFPNSGDFKFEETLKTYHFNGHEASYSTQGNSSQRTKDAVNWYRENPHRLQLGNLGFVLLHKDGSEAKPSDIQNIRQELNLWTGGISSSFTFDGEGVKVQTYGSKWNDAIGVSVQSGLLRQGRLKVRVRFPFPTNQFADMGVNYKNADKHTSRIASSANGRATVSHDINGLNYQVNINWTGQAKLDEGRPHEFVLTPNQNSDQLEVSFDFEYLTKKVFTQVGFGSIKSSSVTGWQKYWASGGAIDLAGSTDPRAKELERRIVLSQYIMGVQGTGQYPPQETGLTYNSWYGRPHLEMHWWHDVHFALWGRPQLMENSLGWYNKIKDQGLAIAQRQGYKGIRWPKMTDPWGNESPSSVGAFLIWQQPHFIYMSELAYRAHPNKETLDKYKNMVFATAEFMASFAYFDKETNRYILGKGIIPSQEVHKADLTFNPPYELTYWDWALNVAQEWKKRLGLPRDKDWDTVMQKLSALPQKDGVYLEAESAPDSYTNPKDITDHPSTLAAYGMMPMSKMMDTTVMHKTFDVIWKGWNWPETWGWDFPMTAMTAARLNLPEKAIEALLMPIKTNTYLPNGHNYQDGRLTIYLPGNGGLLTAVAMMAAGWDGSKGNTPGFPKDGKWNVKWEGLKRMP